MWCCSTLPIDKIALEATMHFAAGSIAGEQCDAGEAEKRLRLAAEDKAMQGTRSEREKACIVQKIKGDIHAETRCEAH